METNQESLIDEAANGDRDALVRLLKQHTGAARAAISGKIPKRWQSLLSYDDIIQQTYADAAVGIVNFNSRDGAAMGKWFGTIAKRNLGNAIKMLEAEKRGGNHRRIEGGGDESFVHLWEYISTTSGTPSRHAAIHEAKTVLTKAIAQLPEDYARVVQMHDLEGRNIKEVAASLNRSQGAVFMLRARAHEKLHEFMGRTSKFFSGPA